MSAERMGRGVVSVGFAVLVLATLGGCARIAPMNHGLEADGGRPQVVAHRGASAYAPENTLAAFRLADEMGAEWFELDCTLTRDGRVIVIHDGTLDRTTDGAGPVAERTLAELKALDAGSWMDARFAGERMPTLDESLDFARGRIGVYIEIKDSADDRALRERILQDWADVPVLDGDGLRDVVRVIEESGSRNLALTREVIRLVRERRMADKVVIQSFSPIVCAVALHEAPEIRTEFLGADDPKNPEQWERFLRWGYLLGVKGFNVSYPSLTPGRLAAFHKAGRTVAVWTVDEEADMSRYVRWGVDRIITNRPDLCREVVAGALGRR